MNTTLELRERKNFCVVHLRLWFPGKPSVYFKVAKIKDKNHFDKKNEVFANSEYSDLLNRKVVKLRRKILTVYIEQEIEDAKIIKSIIEDGSADSLIEMFGPTDSVSKSTKRQYNAIKNSLKRYEKKYGQLTFNKVNMGFLEKWLEMLRESGKSNATINTYVQQFASFMRRTHKKKLHRNDDYKFFASESRSEHKVVSKEGIVLTKEEIRAFANYDRYNLSVSDRERFECFLIQLDTGIRFSEAVKLGRSNIGLDLKGDKYIENMQKKVSSKSRPFLGPLGLEIINEKLGEKFFPNINSTTYPATKVIRKIAKELNLDRIIVQYRKVKGSEMVEFRSPLFKVISTHSARHTHAFYYLKENKDVLMLKGKLGQSSLSATEKYTHLTLENNSIDITA